MLVSRARCPSKVDVGEFSPEGTVKMSEPSVRSNGADNEIHQGQCCGGGRQQEERCHGSSQKLIRTPNVYDPGSTVPRRVCRCQRLPAFRTTSVEDGALGEGCDRGRYINVNNPHMQGGYGQPSSHVDSTLRQQPRRRSGGVSTRS